MQLFHLILVTVSEYARFQAFAAMQLHLLGCSATSSGLSPTFRDNISVPSSNVKISRHRSQKVGSKSTCVAQQPRREKISNSAHFPSNNERLVFVPRIASVYSAAGTESLKITQIDVTFISSSIAQETDDRRPLTAEVRVRCRPSQCGICGEKSGLGHVCSQHSLYPTSLSSEGHTDEAWEPSRHCSFGYRGALVRRVLYRCCVVMRAAGTGRRAVCSNDSTASIT
jgi:hypothetical protein